MTKPKSSTKPPAFDATPADVRAWVRKRGDTIGAHGCISDDVRDAYNKAHRAHQFVGSHPSTRLG